MGGCGTFFLSLVWQIHSVFCFAEVVALTEGWVKYALPFSTTSYLLYCDSAAAAVLVLKRTCDPLRQSKTTAPGIACSKVGS